MHRAAARRRPHWWPGLVLVTISAYLLGEVAVRSADAAYLKPSNCLYDVPYTPPYEGWSATSHWSWLPLGAGCTYLNLEDGDVVVVDDVSWTLTLVVGATTTAGLTALTRTAVLRRRSRLSGDR